MRPLAYLVAIALLATPAAAQLVSGDIGVTGFSSTQFSVIDAGGVTPYGLTFGGGTSQAILWDPANPNDFIVGGIGFVGRVSITGPSTSNNTVLTTLIGQVTQMSWGPSNEIVVMEQTTDQVIACDPVSGALTPITSGTQPWGTTVNAGIYDPGNGDYLVGNNGGVYRVAAGGVGTLFASGWSTSTSYVSGIVIEPGSLDVIVTALSVSRVLRISPSGVISANDVVPAGTISSPNSIALDTVNGDFIIGGSGGSVYRVPFGSSMAAPTLITSVTGQGSSASGVSVMSPSGPPPFTITVNAYMDWSADFTLSNIPVGTFDGWTFISADTTAPAGMGWAFGITPDALTLQILNIAPFPQPGNLFHWLYGINGVYPDVPFAFPAGTLTGLSGTSLDFVSLALDPTFVVIGASNAQRVAIP